MKKTLMMVFVSLMMMVFAGVALAGSRDIFVLKLAESECSLPVKVNTNYFNTVQDAYDSAAGGDTIQAQETSFIENVLFDHNINILLRGGYNCPYDANPGYTTIDGSLTITNGTVAVENLIITSTANVSPTYTISGTVGRAHV